MRCFIAASDDELYAFIERYGVDALVPFRVGMPIARPAEAPQASAAVTTAPEEDAPRLAA